MVFQCLPLFAALTVLGSNGQEISTTVAVASTASQNQDAAKEWRYYGGDAGSSKYSALADIGPSNVKGLAIAWTWKSPDNETLAANPNLKAWAFEGTPVMADGTLYVSTSLYQVAAIDAATGKTKWVFDPEAWKSPAPPNHGFVSRGVSYWEKNGVKRVFFGTGNAYLFSLDAETGKPDANFGQGGKIDLTEGLGRPVLRVHYGVSSPPIVCRDTVVVGASILDFPLEKAMPPGDVRGFDPLTGALKWSFHSIPREGEFGLNTWENGSNVFTGGVNAWTTMSADDNLGYVYIPLGTPTNDYFGAERHGDGLFGESLVCVEAATGKRVWHFQMVHHGLWDYDLPAAPNLIDIKVGGKAIKAVAQVTKQGFCFVFDRVTGQPVWPIEERAVPQSTVPGEKTSPTQPFPTKPAPFDRQGFSKDDVLDFTPELRAAGLEILERYNYGPLYTPPMVGKPTINMPGVAGGANWAGAATDPETGMLYVPSNTLPFAILMVPAGMPHARRIGTYVPLPQVEGLPLTKPPYSRLTAIDLNTGEHKWMKPMGRWPAIEGHPAFKDREMQPMGRPTRGHVLLTKTLLFVAQEGVTQRVSATPDGHAIAGEFAIVDPMLRAHDKKTGAIVAEIALPRNAMGAPMTYEADGRQYIVVPTGGANLPAELIALALPKGSRS